MTSGQGYVVTFDPRPVTGPGSLRWLRRMSLAEAGQLAAFASPRHGRIINVDTLEEVGVGGSDPTSLGVGPS